MSKKSDQVLAALEKAATDNLKSAEDTLGGVGCACFLTTKEQDEEFKRAYSKQADAETILNLVKRFRRLHGNFS